jgi:hypothetical protein
MMAAAGLDSDGIVGAALQALGLEEGAIAPAAMASFIA